MLSWCIHWWCGTGLDWVFSSVCLLGQLPGTNFYSHQRQQEAKWTPEPSAVSPRSEPLREVTCYRTCYTPAFSFSTKCQWDFTWYIWQIPTEKQQSHTCFTNQESPDKSAVQVSDDVHLWWVNVGETVWIWCGWPRVGGNVPHVLVVTTRRHCIICSLLNRAGVLVPRACRWKAEGCWGLFLHIMGFQTPQDIAVYLTILLSFCWVSPNLLYAGLYGKSHVFYALWNLLVSPVLQNTLQNSKTSL